MNTISDSSASADLEKTNAKDSKGVGDAKEKPLGFVAAMNGSSMPQTSLSVSPNTNTKFPSSYGSHRADPQMRTTRANTSRHSGDNIGSGMEINLSIATDSGFSC